MVDSLTLPYLGDYDDAEYTILLHEFKDGLDRYLGALGSASTVRSLADVIAFNTREAARSMPYFGQEIMLMAQATGGLQAPAYLAAREQAKLAGRGIDSLVALHRLDALVAPTTSASWAIDPVVGRPLRGGGEHAGRGGRLSAPHRADGLRARAAGGAVVLRAGAQ